MTYSKFVREKYDFRKKRLVGDRTSNNSAYKNPIYTNFLDNFHSYEDASFLKKSYTIGSHKSNAHKYNKHAKYKKSTSKLEHSSKINEDRFSKISEMLESSQNFAKTSNHSRVALSTNVSYGSIRSIFNGKISFYFSVK